MKMVFLLPVPSQPRYHKRIRLFSELGVRADVFAFERQYFSDKRDKFDFQPLGFVQHRQYWRRVPRLCKAAWKIRKAVSDVAVIYAFGLDMAVLGLTVRMLGFKMNVKLVYECADIMPVMLERSWRGYLFRAVECYVIGKCSKVVTTSPAYVTEYFWKIQHQDETKFFLLENKIDRPLARPKLKAVWDGRRPLRIGYFGLLRDQASWDILVSLAQRYPQRLEVIVRGYPFGIVNFDETVNRYRNISYGGEYVYPDDLPELYGSVDIVWACFPKDESLQSWKWPMTNRFYECCYFHTPLITQAGTEDDKRVREHGLGVSIDTAQPAKSIQALLAIRPVDILGWVRALKELPVSLCVYTHEHRDLLEQLRVDAKQGCEPAERRR